MVQFFFPWTNFNRNRDKLFFFVGYERYYQQVDEGSNLFRVPTLKERTGDFSESAPGSILVPAGCTANGVAGLPNNNNDTDDIAPGNNLAPCGSVRPGSVEYVSTAESIRCLRPEQLRLQRPEAERQKSVHVAL